MKPMMFLPTNYIARGRLDLDKNKALQIGLSVGSLVLFVVFGTLFLAFAKAKGPAWPTNGFLVVGIPQILLGMVGLGWRSRRAG